MPACWRILRTPRGRLCSPRLTCQARRSSPCSVPEFKRDFKDYMKFDIGAMGEFDVAVLIEQYAGKELSERLYPEWRGGYYYAARPKNDAGRSARAALCVALVERRESRRVCRDLCAVAGAAIQEGGGVRRSCRSAGRDRESGVQGRILQGRHAWTTEEGAVVIEEQGDTVLVSESLDAATTETLEKEVFGK